MSSPSHGLPSTDNSREGIISRSGSSEPSYSGAELQKMQACGYSVSGEKDRASPGYYQTRNSGITNRYPLVDEYYKHHMLPRHPSNVLSVEQVFDESSSLSSSSLSDKLPSKGTSGCTLDTTSTTYYQPPSTVYPKSTSGFSLSTSAGFSLSSGLSRPEKTGTKWQPVSDISSTGTTSGTSLLSSEPSSIGRSRQYFQLPFVTKTQSHSNTLPSTTGVFTSSQSLGVVCSSSLGTTSGSNSIQGSNTAEVARDNLSELTKHTTDAREEKPHDEFASDLWPRHGNPFPYTSGSQMLSVRSSDTTSSGAPFAVLTDDIAPSVGDADINPRTAEVTDSFSNGRGPEDSTQSSSYFTKSVSSGNSYPSKSSWSAGEINNNRFILPTKSSTGKMVTSSFVAPGVCFCLLTLGTKNLYFSTCKARMVLEIS